MASHAEEPKENEEKEDLEGAFGNVAAHKLHASFRIEWAAAVQLSYWPSQGQAHGVSVSIALQYRKHALEHAYSLTYWHYSSFGTAMGFPILSGSHCCRPQRMRMLPGTCPHGTYG